MGTVFNCLFALLMRGGGKFHKKSDPKIAFFYFLP
jgi:hypothetical protein